MTHGGTTEETTGYDDKQLKYREKQGNGLVWEVVRTGVGSTTTELRKRDGWLAALFESLTQTQQDAMCHIEAGYRSATAGLGMRIMDPQRMMAPSGRSTNDRSAQQVADYFIWGEELLRLRLSHAMTMAVITEGFTCAEVDKAYRQRKGTARMNLEECLNVYCLQHGWPYPHRPI